MTAWGDPKHVAELIEAFDERDHASRSAENGTVLHVWAKGVSRRRIRDSKGTLRPVVVVVLPDDASQPQPHYSWVTAELLGDPDVAAVPPVDWPPFPYVAEGHLSPAAVAVEVLDTLYGYQRLRAC